MTKYMTIILIIAICVQIILSAEMPDGTKKNRQRRRRIITKPPSTTSETIQPVQVPTQMPFPIPINPFIQPENGGEFINNNWNYGPSIPAPSVQTVDAGSVGNGNEKPEYVIEGERGTIKVDGKTIRANDKNFKNGIVSIQIRQGSVFINDNSILRVKSMSPGEPATAKINYTSVANFKIEIFNGGWFKYTDNVGNSNIVF